MPLEPQSLEINLARGLQTKVDPKLVPTTECLVNTNASFITQGATSQRYGSTTLSASTAASGTITAGVAVSAPGSGQTLFLQDGTTLYTWGTTGSKWSSQGTCISGQLTTAPISFTQYNQLYPATAVIGTIQVTVWVQSSGGAGAAGTLYTVRDTNTQLPPYIVPTTIDAAGVGPASLFVLGTTFYLVVGKSQTFLSVYSMSSATPTTGFALLGTLNNPSGTQTGNFCACPRTSTKAATNDSFYCLVSDDNSGNSYSIVTYDVVAAAQLGSKIVAGAFLDGCSITAPTNQATPYFYFTTTTSAASAFYYAVESTFLASGTKTTRTPAAISALPDLYMTCVTNNSTSNVQLFASTVAVAGSSGSWATFYSFTYGNNNNAATTSATATVYGLQCYSSAIYNSTDSRYYIVANSTPANQASYFFVRDDGVVVTRFFGELAAITAGAYSSATYTAYICGGSMAASGILYTAAVTAGVLRLDATGQVYSAIGANIVQLDLTTSTQTTVLPWDNEAFATGAMPFVFDGGAIVESGFNQYPLIFLTLTASGGHLTDSSTYTYYAVYEWQDYQGRWHRSAPSFAAQVTTTATGTNVSKVVIKVTYCPFTLRSSTRSAPNLAVYRTQANGSVPYRVNATYASLNKTDGTYALSYTDTSSDTTIASNDTLYSYATTVGQLLSELPNDPPPSFAYVTEGQRRIFGISSENNLQVWYSKLRQDDRAPEFSQAFVIEVEAAGGPLIAIGVLDQNLILFKKTRIYLVTGSGPDDTGNPANGYSFAQLLSSSDGCISARSVLKTDQGLFFHGNRGISLLDRSLNVNYVGSAVETYRTNTITGTVLVPAQNQIRFVTNNSITLVYDYLANQWSTYDYGGIGAALWNNAPVVLSSAGIVREEVSGNYADSGTGVGLTYKTAWIKPAQIAQGFAKVWEIEVLGTYLGAHSLLIDIFYDYSSTLSYTLTYTPSGSGTYQFRARIPQQRCEAIAFQFRTSGNTGASCQLNALALHLGVIGGINRLPAAQSG